MKRFTTKAIVLSRTNFGEADRILTFLTPEHGKVRAIAKGSRKPKSKLAGGIEPFSISDLTVLEGKSELNTLMSSRLVKHFGNLTANLERLNIASAFIRLLSKNTEDDTEPEYYELLRAGFESLNDTDLLPQVTELWFGLHLLKLAGHTPNLRTDNRGEKLKEEKVYSFDLEKMAFFESRAGKFNVRHIKLLRLCLGLDEPKAIGRVVAAEDLAKACQLLVESMLKVQLQL